MPRPDTESFNKEKLVFLLASAAFAGGLYLFLASGPVELPDEQPLGAQPGPAELGDMSPGTQQDPKFYVDGPNRSRKTPFSPHSDFIARPVPRPVAVNNNTPPPPPPPAEVKPPEAVKKSFDARDLDVQVEYMGVLMMQNVTYALVKPKDGTSPRRIKVGDTLDEFKYKVTRIEKQAVYMTDEENRPFILKNSRFGAEDDLALGDDDDDEKKSSKKPAPKAPAPEPKKEEKPAPPKAQPQPQPRSAPARTGGAGGNERDDTRHARRARPGHENDNKKK